MIYEIIKAVCEKEKISIAELERRAGLGNGAIGKWSDDKVKPNFESLEKVAAALGVSVAALLEEKP